MLNEEVCHAVTSPHDGAIIVENKFLQAGTIQPISENDYHSRAYSVQFANGSFSPQQIQLTD